MKDVGELTVTGNKTYYFTLPKWMVEKLKWRKGRMVEIKLKGKRVEVGGLERR